MNRRENGKFVKSNAKEEINVYRLIFQFNIIDIRREVTGRSGTLMCFADESPFNFVYPSRWVLNLFHQLFSSSHYKYIKPSPTESNCPNDTTRE